MTDADSRRAYETDGVVCLRQAFDAGWLRVASDSIEQGRTNPGPVYVDYSAETTSGTYYGDFWTWPQVPAMRKFIFESPAARLVGEVMGVPSVMLVTDNWLTSRFSEPGSVRIRHREGPVDRRRRGARTDGCRAHGNRGDGRCPHRVRLPDSRSQGGTVRCRARHVRQPQALRRTLFKEPPLLFAIAVTEMLQTAKNIGSETFRYTEPVTIIGLIFLPLSLVSATGIRWVERHLQARWGIAGKR